MRLLPVAALAVLGLAHTAPLRAQNGVVDEGTLLVSRNGAQVGRETFRIVRVDGGDGVFMATAQGSYGARRLAPALSVSEDGRPLLYRMETREGAEGQERVQATARAGRLSVLLHTGRGESAKDYVLGGGSVLIDDEVLHHHVFLASLLGAAPRADAVSVVIPSAGRQLRGTLTAAGDETVEIAGRAVPARHLTLTLPDGARDVWVDARGRLLKVAIASQGIVAVREEPPR
jgi:hypothetical protein